MSEGWFDELCRKAGQLWDEVSGQHTEQKHSWLSPSRDCGDSNTEQGLDLCSPTLTVSHKAPRYQGFWENFCMYNCQLYLVPSKTNLQFLCVWNTRNVSGTAEQLPNQAKPIRPRKWWSIYIFRLSHWETLCREELQFSFKKCREGSSIDPLETGQNQFSNGKFSFKWYQFWQKMPFSHWKAEPSKHSIFYTWNTAITLCENCSSFASFLFSPVTGALLASILQDLAQALGRHQSSPTLWPWAEMPRGMHSLTLAQTLQSGKLRQDDNA